MPVRIQLFLAQRTKLPLGRAFSQIVPVDFALPSQLSRLSGFAASRRAAFISL